VCSPRLCAKEKYTVRPCKIGLELPWSQSPVHSCGAAAMNSGGAYLEEDDDDDLPQLEERATGDEGLVAPVGRGQPQGRGQQQQQPQFKPEDCKHFICIYPNYLTLNATMGQGRKLPQGALKECEDVNIDDVVHSFQVLASSIGWNTRALVEGNKRHPQTTWHQTGRLRIELQDKAGKCTLPAGGKVTCKKDLLMALAQIIPQLPSRRARLQMIAAERSARDEDMRKREAQPKKQIKNSKKG
jgi:signal recognition particle subunit SEC65